jgi:hypothetical protein
MTDQLMMRGFWGPRRETAEGLAERLSAFCGRLAELFPGGTTQWLDAQEVGFPLASPDAARAFVEQRFAKLSEAEAELGVVLVASAAQANGAKLTFNASAGGFSELRTLKNNVVLKVDPPSDVKVRDRVTIARQCFSVLVQEWEPDWADLTSHELWDAVRGTVQVKSRAPRAGFLTYLSAGRKAGLPVELMAQSVETSDGGILIGGTAENEFIAPPQVADIDNVLRPTPAFEPVPTDRSRL